eukprot:6214274-Pleurochrysis_carterae.AAC.1
MRVCSQRRWRRGLQGARGGAEAQRDACDTRPVSCALLRVPFTLCQFRWMASSCEKGPRHGSLSCQALAESLSQPNTKLRSLRVSGVFSGLLEDLLSYLNVRLAIRACSNLQYVPIELAEAYAVFGRARAPSGNCVGIEGCQAFAAALEHPHANLSSIDLSCAHRLWTVAAETWLFTESFCLLLTLCGPSWPLDLDLLENVSKHSRSSQVRKCGIPQIVSTSIDRSQNSLRTCGRAACDIGHEGCYALADALMVNSALTSMNLAGTR